MKESMTKEESRDPTGKQKLFGLIHPIVGAIIGVLFFSMLFYLTNSVLKSKYLSAALLFPGFLATFLLAFSNDFGLNISSLGYTIILFSLSGLPYAIIGSLIVSKKKKSRTNGITLLGIYLLTSIALGFLVLVFASLFN